MPPRAALVSGGGERSGASGGDFAKMKRLAQVPSDQFAAQPAGKLSIAITISTIRIM